MATGGLIARLSGGRLHLQDGPIDIVLRAWGSPQAVAAAEAAAIARFRPMLRELVAELGELRRPMQDRPHVHGEVARRMTAACARFAPVWVTPMAAIAGAGADTLLAAMRAAAPLDRAYVNNGGDIAVHLVEGARLDIGLVVDHESPRRDGSLRLHQGDDVGGVATSGRHGRSFSLGIADAVTVLARDAATADVAATLIANAVDCAAAPVRRAPACSLDPDSDLGEQQVTVAVGALSPAQIAEALEVGVARAAAWIAAGHVRGATLRLAGATRVVGAQCQSSASHHRTNGDRPNGG